MSVAIDDGTAAMLRTLAASPIAAAAQAEHEAKRAAERSAVLAAMHRTIADAQGEQRLVVEAIRDQRVRTEAAHAAWLRECGQLQELSVRESELGFVSDGARNLAYKLMKPLMDVINDAIRHLCIAQSEARGLISYQRPPDPFGYYGGEHQQLGPSRLADPSHVGRWARMRQLASEVESMRYDTSLSPAVIEERCEAACQEADNTGPALAHPSELAATRRIRPPDMRHGVRPS